MTIKPLQPGCTGKPLILKLENNIPYQPNGLSFGRGAYTHETGEP